ncbi:MAG: TolC family outer membrane protein [Parahaliea sp.]
MKKRRITLLALALSLSGAAAQAESLRDIYELALANDAQLKTEEAQYKANLETENLGRAALLPQISGNYSYTNDDQDVKAQSLGLNNAGALAAINTRTNTDTDTDGYQVTLSQAIFDLPAWFTFKSGKEVTRQAEATFAANQQNLIVRVVEAYLTVLRAQDNLSASKAAERAFERQLEQTQQRFEVGLIAITDVYEAQAAYDLSHVNRIVDENNVKVALENLSVLTGQYHDNLDVLIDEFEAKLPEPMDRAQWVDFALENNFNLQAARYGEEASRITAKARKFEHAPRIVGSYVYQDYDTDGDIDIKPSSPLTSSPDRDLELNQWQISLQVPIFSGGAVSANRRKAAEEFNAARESRVNLIRNTVTSTRSLHMTVVSDVSRVAARKQSIVSSKSALDATQAGYEVGTRNVVDVLNAQNTLFAAQRDYANSRYDYIVDMLRLKEAAGLLSPEDIYTLDDALKNAPAPTASSTSSP